MKSLMLSPHHDPYDPQVILAVGAHPDDIDFGAGGAIAAWTKQGARVEYLVLTDGSKGTADKNMSTTQLIQTRQAEQREAAKALGVADVHFLSYEDGQLECNYDVKRDIVRVIRQVRPDTVVALDPTMVYSSKFGMINHPDHRAAGQATLDAVYPLARDHLSFSELLDQAKLEPHKVAHVLLLNFEKQNCYIDISESFETKLIGLGKHVSQLPDAESFKGWLRERALATGKEAGCELAEGFIRIDVR